MRDALQSWIGRGMCRILRRHNDSCRGRRDCYEDLRRRAHAGTNA